MSIAQQPRRVGGGQSRRNSAEDSSGQHAGQYDSLEVPVLIRVPACSATAVRGESGAQGKTYRYDSAQPKNERERNGDKSAQGRRPAGPPERGVNTKLIAGGMLVGVVIAGLLFFTNGGGTNQSDNLAWPEESAESLVADQGLQVTIPDVPEASPEFAYGAEGAGAQPIAHASIDALPAPNLADVPSPTGVARDSTGDESTPLAAPTLYNEEPSTPLRTGGTANKTNQRNEGWPSADLIDTDYRASSNGVDNEVYRTGRLQTNTPPSGNILSGDIEIPTETSLR